MSREGRTAPLAYSNKAVQRLRRLLRRPSDRDREGCFVIEGPKLLEEALEAGAAVQSVLVEGGAAGTPIGGLAARAAAAGADVRRVAPGVIERACDARTPQAVAAIVATPAVSVEDLHEASLLVVLADVSDPGNVGALVRVAGSIERAAVICCAGSADPYGPKAVRASAGALFRVPVVTGANAEEVLEELGRWGLIRWGTVARGGLCPDQADLRTPSAFVLGNEGHGLPGHVLRHLDGSLSIPMSPRAESLNVAVAAGVLCYEAARQRRGAP